MSENDFNELFETRVLEDTKRSNRDAFGKSKFSAALFLSVGVILLMAYYVSGGDSDNVLIIEEGVAFFLKLISGILFIVGVFIYIQGHSTVNPDKWYYAPRLAFKKRVTKRRFGLI